MTSKVEVDMPVEERLLLLLKHLGINRAHFAASSSEDLGQMLERHPESIASLTLVPFRPVSGGIGSLGQRLLVIWGELGPSAAGQARALADLAGVQNLRLDGYVHQGWSDIIVDRGETVLAGMTKFLSGMPLEPIVSSGRAEGEVAGVTYRVEGSGPPIVLLPLSISAHQWDPILPELAKRYTTIVLGGREIAWTAILERRASGLLPPVAAVIDRLEIKPGERILDVGFGTGVYDRWLAEKTGGRNSITAVDVSPFFLREAGALIRKAGLESVIELREANAEELPFNDDSFHASFSITVLEECDADRALREMVRVTKPGGRVGVLVRSLDLPNWVNLPLSAEVKAKVDCPPRPGTGLVGERGCADASLYRRFQEAGLRDVRMFPQWYTMDRDPSLRTTEAARRAQLAPKDLNEWTAAVEKARKDGTFFISLPCHCAVGTKPTSR